MHTLTCVSLSADPNLRGRLQDGAQGPQAHAAGEQEAAQEGGGDAPADGAPARAGHCSPPIQKYLKGEAGMWPCILTND